MTQPSSAETGRLPSVDVDISPTKLYTAISKNEWDNATSITETDPIEAKTWVIRYYTDVIDQQKKILWRFLPLHSACARQPTEEIIQCLLQAYPEAAFVKDDQGMLPLHYACGNNASESVVSMLLITHPLAASIRDPKEGRLPLHNACQWGSSSLGVVNLLLSAYPESVLVTDSKGCTPIDLAEAGEYLSSRKEQILKALKRCTVAMKLNDKPSPCHMALTAANQHNSSSFGGSAKVNLEVVKKLEKKIDRLTIDLDELQDKLISGSKQLDAERLASKEALRKEASKVALLMGEMTILKEESQHWNTEKERLLSDIDSLQKVATEKENKIISLTEEIEMFRNTMEPVEQKLEKDLLDFKAAVQASGALLEEKDSKLKKMEEEYSSLASTNLELEQQISKLASEKADLFGELRNMEQYKIGAKHHEKKLMEISDSLLDFQKKQHLMLQFAKEHGDAIKIAAMERESMILEMAKTEKKLKPSSIHYHQETEVAMEKQQSDLCQVFEMIHT